jgi:hypothetical protein
LAAVVGKRWIGKISNLTRLAAAQILTLRKVTDRALHTFLLFVAVGIQQVFAGGCVNNEVLVKSRVASIASGRPERFCRQTEVAVGLSYKRVE